MKLHGRVDHHDVHRYDVDGRHNRTLNALRNMSKVVHFGSFILMEMLTRGLTREIQLYAMWIVQGTMKPSRTAMLDDLNSLNLPIWGRLMAMKGWEPVLAMHGIVRRGNSAGLHGLKVTRTLVLKFRAGTPSEDRANVFFDGTQGVLDYVMSLAGRKLLLAQAVLAKGDKDVPHKDLVTRYEANGGHATQTKDYANLSFAMDVIVNRGDLFMCMMDGGSTTRVGYVNRNFNRAPRVIMAEFRAEFQKEMKTSVALTLKFVSEESEKGKTWAAAHLPEGNADCFCDELPASAYHSRNMCRPMRMRRDMYPDYLFSLAKSVSKFQPTPPGIRMIDCTVSPNVCHRDLGVLPAAKRAPPPPPGGGGIQVNIAQAGPLPIPLPVESSQGAIASTSFTIQVPGQSTVSAPATEMISNVAVNATTEALPKPDTLDKRCNLSRRFSPGKCPDVCKCNCHRRAPCRCFKDGVKKCECTSSMNGSGIRALREEKSNTATSTSISIAESVPTYSMQKYQCIQMAGGGQVLRASTSAPVIAGGASVSGFFLRPCLRIFRP